MLWMWRDFDHESSSAVLDLYPTRKKREPDFAYQPREIKTARPSRCILKLFFLQESQRLEGGAVCTLRGTSSSEASKSNYVYKRSWNGTTDFIIGVFFSWEINMYVYAIPCMP
ncbi:hypothetical protein TWF706_008788 [Orbilia oligospora]|nr:hypothetical protein TWF706_008788 [Orbilia oligospora]